MLAYLTTDAAIAPGYQANQAGLRFLGEGAGDAQGETAASDRRATGVERREFLDRLTSVAIPRIRDFRGLSTRSFDGRGNYSMGVKEQMIFPEINYDQIDQIIGMDITFVTSTSRDDHAFALLRELGLPFRGEDRPIIVNAGPAAAEA